jgi:hypothetical protein
MLSANHRETGNLAMAAEGVAMRYPDVKSGDWVIVATSVRTSEGTELVPQQHTA